MYNFFINISLLCNAVFSKLLLTKWAGCFCKNAYVIELNWVQSNEIIVLSVTIMKLHRCDIKQM